MTVFNLTVGEQILVIILGGLGLYVLRLLFIWSVQALATAIVTAINGQLGLDRIRDDVAFLKGQVQDTQRQLEVILTDIE